MNSFILLCVIGCFVVQFSALPIENVAEQQEQLQTQQHIAHPLPAALKRTDLPAVDIPNQSVMALVPISLLDIEDAEHSASEESSSRTARGLGLGNLGGLGNFGGLGLGLRGFGGLGLGGLHGLGGGLHGLGGFKPFFGKFLG